jgi:hypothetical protein
LERRHECEYELVESREMEGIPSASLHGENSGTNGDLKDIRNLLIYYA